MNHVEIFTDGACEGNPGPGGYGIILRQGAKIRELSGGEPYTTNNKMELTAVIVALSALNNPCNVMLTTDSKYIVDAVNQQWVYKWRNNGWRKADGSSAKNIELWRQLIDLLACHTVTFKWVKGHNGHIENERCDFLARQSAHKIAKEVYL